MFNHWFKMIERDYIRTYLKLCYYKAVKIRHNQYIWVKLREHPFCNAQGYVLEHRLVMELYLGRYLTNKEVIHHIDGNTMNNEIDNLEIMTQSKHVSNHNNQRQYNRSDKSNRSCILCKSDKTYINKKKFPVWYRYKNGWKCRRCYDKSRTKSYTSAGFL